MKYKTLFRLMLRMIGVFLFANGVAHLVGRGCTLAMAVVGAAGYPVGFAASYAVEAVMEALLGLYLFFSGAWIVNLAIPGNRPYCPECGYDLTGAPRNRCPECDTPFTPEAVRPPGGCDPADGIG